MENKLLPTAIVLFFATAVAAEPPPIVAECKIFKSCRADQVAVNGPHLIVLDPNSVTCYDIDSGKKLHTFGWFDAVAEKIVQECVLSPDGSLLAVISISEGEGQGILHLVDVAKKSVRFRFPVKDYTGQGHVEGQGGMFFSHDSSVLAIAKYMKDYVSFVDTANGRERGTLPGDCRNVVFAPNGKSLALQINSELTTDHRWAILDSPTRLQPVTLPGIAVPAFAPDGKGLFVLMPKIEKKGNITWTVETHSFSGKIQSKMKCPDLSELKYSTFSPDGKYIALGLRDGNLVLFDRVKGIHKPVLNQRDWPPTHLYFSLDSRRLVAYQRPSAPVANFTEIGGKLVGGGVVDGGGSGDVRVWEISKIIGSKE